MSARAARERYIAAIWWELEIEEQWALLFGLERKQATPASRRILRGCSLLRGEELTPRGEEVRDYGRRQYAAAYPG